MSSFNKWTHIVPIIKLGENRGNAMWEGLYTALITPFSDEGKIDFASLEKLITLQMEAKVNGVVVFGSTGEAATIKCEERADAIRYVSDLTHSSQSSMKLVVGTGTNDTEQTIFYTKQAKNLGADAVLIVTPYYNKPPQDGLYAHYKLVHDKSDIPIFIYNVPGRTGIDIQDHTIHKLAQLPRIVGVKDSTSNLDRPLFLQTLLSSSGVKNFTQLSGEDSTAIAFNAHGGQGCISVSSNIIPHQCNKIQELLRQDHYDEALRLQQKLFPIHRAMFCETNPIPVKYAAYLLNIIHSPHIRLPLCELGENSKQIIANIVNLAKALES
ncbi:4-hydroxy-tetrahydrodipicolinate synthase [Alphaproteobacteria bacterium]